MGLIPQTLSEIGSGAVLQLSHAQPLHLVWQDNHTLVIEYPDTAWIQFASPGGIYSPLVPRLKILYRGLPLAGSPAPESSTLTCGTSEAPTPAPTR